MYIEIQYHVANIYYGWNTIHNTEITFKNKNGIFIYHDSDTTIFLGLCMGEIVSSFISDTFNYQHHVFTSSLVMIQRK